MQLSYTFATTPQYLKRIQGLVECNSIDAPFWPITAQDTAEPDCQSSNWVKVAPGSRKKMYCWREKSWFMESCQLVYAIVLWFWGAMTRAKLAIFYKFHCICPRYIYCGKNHFPVEIVILMGFYKALNSRCHFVYFIHFIWAPTGRNIQIAIFPP